MRSDPEMVPERAREVLSYFLRNPQAADSLEGVTRWRLHQEVIRRSVEEIGQALGWLAEQEFLLRDSVRGAPQMFRLNRRRTADAERFLAVTDPCSSGESKE